MTCGERSTNFAVSEASPKVIKGFEQGVFEAANRFDSHYAFDFNGPWTPHNFVEVDLMQ